MQVGNKSVVSCEPDPNIVIRKYRDSLKQVWFEGNSLQKGATIGHRMCMGKHTHFSYQCDELKHRYGWQLNYIYFNVWEAISLNKISTNLSLFQTN